MGGIRGEHVEWAVVNRLKAMLDDPPNTKFNITQTFALFSSVLLWTKNRGWVAGNGALRPGYDSDDEAADQFRRKLASEKILDEPWSLAMQAPRRRSSDEGPSVYEMGPPVNDHFRDWTVGDFVKWLRDALGHGDGRTIRPIHRDQRLPDETWLVGFRIDFPKARGSKEVLSLNLYETDMRRIGARLADEFCRALSGVRTYSDRDIATIKVDEERAA